VIAPQHDRPVPYARYGPIGYLKRESPVITVCASPRPAIAGSAR
jgi:hypothetical protein